MSLRCSGALRSAKPLLRNPRLLAPVACLTLLLAPTPCDAAPRAINLGAAADVNAIAVLPDGTAVLVGGNTTTGLAAMWSINSASKVTTTTLTGPSGSVRSGAATGISPNGSYIVGSLGKLAPALPFQFDGAVWSRTQPTTPTIVPDLPDPFVSTRLRDVSNAGTAVGVSSETAYSWSASGGVSVLPTVGASSSWAATTNATGSVIVGSAIDDGVAHPVAVTWMSGQYTVLDYNYSAAYGVSPNGQYIAGASDIVDGDPLVLNAVYWKNGQRRVLYEAGSGAAIVGQTLWATDSGVMGGFTGPTGSLPVDGWIYIDGMLNPILFNTWWKQITGTDFPVHVSSIAAAVEQNGELYLAIEDGAYFAQLLWAAPADGNRDRVVDGGDYTIWANNYLKPSATTFEQGDYTGDGKVDGADYTIWANNFNPNPPALLGAFSVPEPSSLALLLLGLLAVGAAWIRRWGQAGHRETV